MNHLRNIPADVKQVILQEMDHWHHHSFGSTQIQTLHGSKHSHLIQSVDHSIVDRLSHADGEPDGENVEHRRSVPLHVDHSTTIYILDELAVVIGFEYGDLSFEQRFEEQVIESGRRLIDHRRDDSQTQVLSPFDQLPNSLKHIVFAVFLWSKINVVFN